MTQSMDQDLTQGFKLFISNKHQQAAMVFDKVLKKDPQNAVAAYNLTLCYFHLRKWHQCLHILDQNSACLRSSVFWLRSVKCKGLVYSMTGEYDLAISFIERAIAELPDPWELYNLLAYFQERQGDLLSAYKSYLRVLVQDMDNATALNGAAFVLVELGGDLLEAQRLVRQAIRQDADNPAYLDTAAMLLVKKGDMQQAKRILAKAESLAPDNEEIKKHKRQIKLN